MSLSRNSEGGIGEAAFLAAASFDAAKLEDREVNVVRERVCKHCDRTVIRVSAGRKMNVRLECSHNASTVFV